MHLTPLPLIILGSSRWGNSLAGKRRPGGFLQAPVAEQLPSSIPPRPIGAESTTVGFFC